MGRVGERVKPKDILICFDDGASEQSDDKSGAGLTKTDKADLAHDKQIKELGEQRAKFQKMLSGIG